MSVTPFLGVISTIHAYAQGIAAVAAGVSAEKPSCRRGRRVLMPVRTIVTPRVGAKIWILVLLADPPAHHRA
jgi:hypothetical protein